jgi:A/G-specific adenine glycosylase
MRKPATSAKKAFEGRIFDPALFVDAGRKGREERKAFRRLVLDHYWGFGRSFPWRQTHDPWAILVSEIMLQQTQTERVLPKYLAFLEAFPDAASLAAAPLERLLALWSGLGYNRRALALRKAAAVVAGQDGGRLPDTEEGLLALPGVGPYTARAVSAFAFGRPAAFIETNIRTVFLYHFYPEAEAVHDRDLEPLVHAALSVGDGRTPDEADPRTWYYALMDYGVFLKRSHGNPNRRSAHYAKQSPFADSKRRIRGAILREVGAAGVAAVSGVAGGLSRDALAARLPFARERVEEALGELVAEGFLRYRGDEVVVGEGRGGS